MTRCLNRIKCNIKHGARITYEWHTNTDTHLSTSPLGNESRRQQFNIQKQKQSTALALAPANGDNDEWEYEDDDESKYEKEDEWECKEDVSDYEVTDQFPKGKKGDPHLYLHFKQQ